jgi:uncharacterized membrane protein
MKKATKRSVIMGCIFVLLSTVNLIMEYKKSNPSGLILKWIMLIAFIIFAFVAFIRFQKQKTEEIDKPK